MYCINWARARTRVLPNTQLPVFAVICTHKSANEAQDGLEVLVTMVTGGVSFSAVKHRGNHLWRWLLILTACIHTYTYARILVSAGVPVFSLFKLLVNRVRACLRLYTVGWLTAYDSASQRSHRNRYALMNNCERV